MSVSKEQYNNKVVLDKLASDDQGQVKQAMDTVNEFTRVKMREDGFARRILPPINISDDELDRQVDTDKPVKVVDKEPNSPAAISIGYAGTPNGRYIHGPRYRVMFNRIVTPKFNKDVDELRTYHMDIRQVISDNAIKDMLAEEDTKFLAACNIAMGGQESSTAVSALSWQSAADNIKRTNFKEALKAMPSLSSRLEPATALTNNICIKEFLGWTRDELGGDIAEDMFRRGFTETELFGVKIIISIKQELLSAYSDAGALLHSNVFYFFAEPKYLGKHYIIEDATMFMERKAYMLEFFAYETLGGAIGNQNAVTRYEWAGPAAE